MYAPKKITVVSNRAIRRLLQSWRRRRRGLHRFWHSASSVRSEEAFLFCQQGAYEDSKRCVRQKYWFRVRRFTVQGWWLVKLVFSINCEPGTVNPEPL